jgi:hypothetical protein
MSRPVSVFGIALFLLRPIQRIARYLRAGLGRSTPRRVDVGR